MTTDRTQSLGAPASPVEQLAAEFLIQFGKGRSPPLGEYLDRLESDEERVEFRELIGAVEKVRQGLPRQIQSGSLLGGRYYVFDEIGSGGMGKVLLARDEQLGRQVAIKVLHAFSRGDERLRKRFEKESRLLASLHHPNVVAVHETGSDGDIHYIVMDAVRGTTLAETLDRVRERRDVEGGFLTDRGEVSRYPAGGAMLRDAIQRPLPDGQSDLIDDGSWIRTVVRIVIEIVRGVEAAHGQSVVHRDLKPANVMMTGGGHPVILDFGLGGVVGAEASLVTRGFFGSVAYLAPEQVRSRQIGADFRTDIYQLGLLLYEMLTLERAFSGETIAVVLERVSRGRFLLPTRRNPEIPNDLEAVCLRALRLHPSQRYGTARALREDLEAFLRGDRPVAARRAGPGSISRWAHRAAEAVTHATARVQDSDRVTRRVRGVARDLRSPSTRESIRRFASSLGGLVGLVVLLPFRIISAFVQEFFPRLGELLRTGLEFLAGLVRGTLSLVFTIVLGALCIVSGGVLLALQGVRTLLGLPVRMAGGRKGIGRVLRSVLAGLDRVARVPLRGLRALTVAIVSAVRGLARGARNVIRAMFSPSHRTKVALGLSLAVALVTGIITTALILDHEARRARRMRASATAEASFSTSRAAVVQTIRYPGFQGLRWRHDWPEVFVGGDWRQLVSIEGYTVEAMIQASLEFYDIDADEDAKREWRRHFEDDLFKVLDRYADREGQGAEIQVRSPVASSVPSSTRGAVQVMHYISP